ncbi:hypothetical protein [Streptomyces sp.]|uniref:hypothetical protein n=1 Tax=Streptomyces sp. TaxID=1931 RepID=UPI002D798238|nr:hypothetical protein [Streptomyces sp.]HET6356058.1 hypothetical protein [Streptomyces sp.]
MKTRKPHAYAYAPNVEQLINERDAAIAEADVHKGNVVRIAKKNARLMRIVAECIVAGRALGPKTDALAIVNRLAERLLIEGFDPSIEFAQLKREAGERP